jgi:hypothetical protein
MGCLAGKPSWILGALVLGLALPSSRIDTIYARHAWLAKFHGAILKINYRASKINKIGFGDRFHEKFAECCCVVIIHQWVGWSCVFVFRVFPQIA